MLNQIIRFVETNVDGCGTNAEVLVLFKTDCLLTNGCKERLQKALSELKAEWEPDEWDTDSAVKEALVRTFGQTAVDEDMEIILPDIEVEF